MSSFEIMNEAFRTMSFHATCDDKRTSKDKFKISIRNFHKCYENWINDVSDTQHIPVNELIES